MKNFNLKKAIEGAQLQTRMGDLVTEFHYFETARKDSFPIAAIVDGILSSYTIEGKYIEGGEHNIDLFMAPEGKKAQGGSFVHKLICFIFGHRWNPIIEPLESFKFYCKRCGCKVRRKPISISPK